MDTSVSFVTLLKIVHRKTLVCFCKIISFGVIESHGCLWFSILFTSCWLLKKFLLCGSRQKLDVRMYAGGGGRRSLLVKCTYVLEEHRVPHWNWPSFYYMVNTTRITLLCARLKYFSTFPIYEGDCKSSYILLLPFFSSFFNKRDQTADQLKIVFWKTYSR